MAHAPSPMKLRLRSRKPESSNSSAGDNPIVARKKIVKRAPPRGVNKRRRAIDDDMGRDDELETDHETDTDEKNEMEPLESADESARPQTPKRARIAPEVIPLGLERSDFHSLHPDGIPDESRAEGTGIEVEADGETWSTEEDRILVELVLEKLKLTKTDWQDCARSLGKDRHSLGRRWKSLMLHGDIGLKSSRSSRRGKIHGTWR